MNINFPAVFVLFTLAVPACASVTINTPENGSDVTSPFTLTASAGSCSSQPVVAMTYSLDGGSDLAKVPATFISRSVATTGGAHTIHVKAWGDEGALCVTDVAVNVSANTGSSPVPSESASNSSLQTLGNWRAQHDSGTQGGSSGYTQTVSWPSLSGSARQFVTNTWNGGGELYSVSYGEDTGSENFLYDTWVGIDTSAANIANLEFDMNQTMSNGWTVIYGFQCDGYSGTWDYTVNTGTPTHPSDHWRHSNASCNPRNWSTNTFHHLQIAYSRNSSGYVTYQYVVFDGVQQNIYATVLSAFALGWGPTLLTNFQVDGLGSGGTNTIYMDNLTISRW